MLSDATFRWILAGIGIAGVGLALWQVSAAGWPTMILAVVLFAIGSLLAALAHRRRQRRIARRDGGQR